MIRILLVCAIILFTGTSFSGTIDPNTPDQKYIEYGSKFPYVGLLIGKQNDDTPFYGSVVAHTGNIVITAAHLFEDYKNGSVFINKKKIEIVKIITHKDFRSSIFGKNDIAVCLLKEDIGLDWYPDLYEKQDEAGSLCSMSGFGSSGNFVTGVTSYKPIQRAGSNFIDSVNSHAMFCSPSISYQKTELEFLIAPGDSGGGLFIGNKLAGIHSGLIENKTEKKKAKYGAVSAHTRVSVYNQWIKETIKNIKQQ